MPLHIDHRLTARKLLPKIERLFDLSAQKILSLEKTWEPSQGTPVVTVKGKYTSRAWTEWTQGFQVGAALLQFDATGDQRFLEIGRRKTIQLMAPHVSHMGVHDHGFNNISTYGNLWRLMREGRIPFNEREKDFYELALKVSGAVQAARWTATADGRGYIYSFNGPHSLFVDTVRSLRSLAVAHQLGHVLRGERDQSISLLQRLMDHAETTARYSIYYGEGRDAYDVRGRTAHESIFNLNDGSYRCPNSQQGYSPFSTWTRGLAWAILGYAEQLEFLGTLNGKPAGQVASAPARSRANRTRSARDATATGALFLEGRPRDGGLLPGQLLRGRHPDVGHGRAPLAPAGRVSRETSRPVQPLGACGQLSRRHRRAGPGPPGELSFRPRRPEERRALSPGRLDRGADPFRRAVSLHESQTPGLAAPLGLSSSQRLGLCRARPEGAERREFDVGRLPRPRTGAAAVARSPLRKVSHLLCGRRLSRLRSALPRCL